MTCAEFAHVTRGVLDRINKISRIKKGRYNMKSDIGKFRLLSKVAFAVMLLVACSFLWCIAFCIIGDMVAMSISLVAILISGVIAALLESAAYDNLICPKCGKRILKPLREAYTKENRACYRRIAKCEPVECMHCGAKIQTAPQTLNPVNPV